MRATLCALALLTASISASSALAQSGSYAVQPGVLQIQRGHILDGVWRVNGLGDLTITTRPNEVLEGQLAGRACHGQYLGNTFALLCESAERGPYLLTGVAIEEPPVATRARARMVAQPARMEGQIHISYLSRRGYVEEIATLSGVRQ
ncbi:MAG: hypothetical protein AB7H66_10160 [Hyphomonadaceae bacterium]